MRRLPLSISHLAVFVSVACGFLACSGTLSAQTIPSPYRFIDARHDAGMFAGTVFENRGALRLGPGGGPAIGARYGIHLTGPLTLEATGFLVATDREVHDPRGADGIERLGTADAVVGGLDARARVTITGPRTWNELAPFVLLGGGLVGIIGGSSDLEDDLEAGDRFTFGPAPMGILGAGTRWIPSERWSLRLELVLHLWRLNTPPSYLELEDEFGAVERREWTGTLGVMGGIHLGF